MIFYLSLFAIAFTSITYGAKYYVYYNSLVPIYVSLTKIEPFFEYSKVVEYDWERPQAKIYELRKPKNDAPSILLIHGIDPYEIYGTWTRYKAIFRDSWTKILPEDYGLYFFIYPSLDIPLEESADALVVEVINISQKLREDYGNENLSFNIYAHSMGGLLVRYSLQNEEFRKYVNKIIFAGTPHIGSPLANFIVMNKNLLKLRKDWEFIKNVLLISNISGGYTYAPNYNYLVYGSNHPEIPEDIEFLNFGTVIMQKTNTVFENLRTTEFFSTTGLLFLKSVTDILFPDKQFTDNDGMVPIESATYYGNSEIFRGFDHADLVMSDIIIKKAIEYFYGEKVK
ncbi:MAG: lipase family alpha/beta hydrolase [Fervidobacterium sp.]|uniref:lipase family alpha/beta hydrolase n=1 Tax=Fervidobacterium sp. TaxID=1871331 RepID=UPI00404B7F7C